jgi:drug/metabolite transporter (DMT)-like permease
VTWVLNVGANLCYLRALKTAQASLAGASMGIMPVFAALVARFYLGESLSAAQWTGIVLSFAGLAAMHIPDREKKGDSLDVLAFFKGPEGWLMLGTTFGWAAGSPFDKAAAAASSPQMHCFLIYAAMLPPAFAIVAARGKFGELKLAPRALGNIFASGALRGLGFSMQLVALLLMPVGVFEMLKRILQQVIVLAGGKILYGEKITKFKIIGTVVFFCAVPLVVFR